MFVNWQKQKQHIKTAKTRIVLIDNYVDEVTLQLFSDKTTQYL